MAAVIDELKGIPIELFTAAQSAAPYVLFFLACFVACSFTAPKKLDQPTAHYWASSIVSTIHGAIIVPLAYEAMVPFWWSNDLRLTTEASKRCLDIFIGFTLADCGPLLWNRKAWPGVNVYFWHHGSALLYWGLSRARGQTHAVAVGLLLCEATAPFTNGRWFLSELNMKDGLLYIVNGAMMMISFLFLRIILFGWLLFRNMVILNGELLSLPYTTIAVTLFGFVVGYPMQWLWFSKIVQGLLKLLRPPKGKKKA